jgi:hypothetical protein
MCHSIYPYDVGLISTLLVVVGAPPPEKIVYIVPAVLVKKVPEVCLIEVPESDLIEVFALISILSPDLIDMIPEVVTAFILDLVVSIMSFPLLNRVSDSE